VPDDIQAPTPAAARETGAASQVVPVRLVHSAPRSTSDRLGTTVVSELADDIVSGRVAAGSTLPTEADLGGRFGVSRTVVRESVQLLQDKGLVLIRRGVGTVARSPERPATARSRPKVPEKSQRCRRTLPRAAFTQVR